MAPSLDTNTILSYLGLPIDYVPSPATDPVPFLSEHLRRLPSHFLHRFSAITTPQQRTAVVSIRNRRFNFAQRNPPELSFPVAKRRWPALWEGAERIGHEEAQEEKEWAETAFLGGSHQAFVGKLGTLLGRYEEERHSELERQARRGRQQDDFVPEEEEGSDDDRDGPGPGTPEPAQAVQESFLRRIREQFIYGHLESDLYDTLDWDDSWDREDRDAEDRWFDDDE
ncbi:hypothetical protein BC826DRAFT_1101058 [Russula brevipes]|nr:hypothetical protein BC826DRAFT_1101058 [Russula brevipes]